MGLTPDLGTLTRGSGMAAKLLQPMPRRCRCQTGASGSQKHRHMGFKKDKAASCSVGACQGGCKSSCFGICMEGIVSH